MVYTLLKQLNKSGSASYYEVIFYSPALFCIRNKVNSLYYYFVYRTKDVPLLLQAEYKIKKG
ncbi:hypothetical protein HMPREF2532_01266 [Bacteroides ovatus]|nr:hypothetical protein HMPREF2532_01266 [Bacteroides ovatus]